MNPIIHDSKLMANSNPTSPAKEISGDTFVGKKPTYEPLNLPPLERKYEPTDEQIDELFHMVSYGKYNENGPSNDPFTREDFRQWLTALEGEAPVEGEKGEVLAYLQKMDSRIEYMLGMFDRMPEKESRRNRWLGFIQGGMWSLGLATVEEMKEHNRADVGLERAKEILLAALRPHTAEPTEEMTDDEFTHLRALLSGLYFTADDCTKIIDTVKLVFRLRPPATNESAWEEAIRQIEAKREEPSEADLEMLHRYFQNHPGRRYDDLYEQWKKDYGTSLRVGEGFIFLAYCNGWADHESRYEEGKHVENQIAGWNRFKQDKLPTLRSHKTEGRKCAWTKVTDEGWGKYRSACNRNYPQPENYCFCGGKVTLLTKGE